MADEREPVPSPLATAVVALSLLAVLCLLLAESLFGGRVLTQVDALYHYAPWSTARPPELIPGNPVLLDQATGFLPWLDFAAQELRRGELPLWSPFNYCGHPLVGASSSAVYWPGNWLYDLWPSWHVHGWIAALRLWLAGLFMFLYLRRLRLAHGPAAVGALGFMLCGFMVVWLNHPHQSCALFLPALLWAVERVAAGARGAVWFAVFVGLQFLAGHPPTSLHLALFVASYVVFRLAAPVAGIRLPARGALRLALAALMGTALAAPQLLPFLEYLRHSQAATVFGSQAQVDPAQAWRAAPLMLWPQLYGAPHTHDYTGPLGPNLNYNELAGGYVGRLLLVLAALEVLWLGWRTGRRAVTGFFLVIVVAAGLVACHLGPLAGWLALVPGIGSTKLMRCLLFVAFGLAVLGAMGLQSATQRIARPVAIVALAFVLVAVELLAFARGYNPQVDPRHLPTATPVIDFLRREQGAWRTMAVDNTILKPNANVFHRLHMVAGYDSMEDRAMAELVLRLTTQRPAFPFISEIEYFNRSAALPLACLLGVKFVVAAQELPPPLRLVLDAELRVYDNPLVMPRAFLAHGVRVIAGVSERLDHLGSAAFDPWVAILEHEPPLGLNREPPAPADFGTAELRSHQPRQVEVLVRAPRRSLLVLTDTWDPGWSASLAADPATASTSPAVEVPIERVDHALRGVWVEPGTWLVRFRYDPWSTRAGLAAASVALLGLLAAALARRS